MPAGPGPLQEADHDPATRQQELSGRGRPPIPRSSWFPKTGGERDGQPADCHSAPPGPAWPGPSRCGAGSERWRPLRRSRRREAANRRGKPRGTRCRRAGSERPPGRPTRRGTPALRLKPALSFLVRSQTSRAGGASASPRGLSRPHAAAAGNCTALVRAEHQ